MRCRAQGLAGLLMFGLTGSAPAQVALPAVAVTQVEFPNGARLPKLTFHHSGPGAATAWILDSESTNAHGISARSEVVDTILNHHAIPPIPPGQNGVASGLVVTGDDATRQWHLVAVLFADGTTAGDGEWAKEIVLRRQYELRTLTALISDLASVKGMDTPQAVRYLEKSRDAQIETARQAQSTGHDRLARLSSAGIFGHVYDAGAPAEFKSPEVQVRAANGWSSSITTLYTGIEHALENGGTQVEQTEEHLRAELHELRESKPALSDGAPPPAEGH